MGEGGYPEQEVRRDPEGPEREAPSRGGGAMRRSWATEALVWVSRIAEKGTVPKC